MKIQISSLFRTALLVLFLPTLLALSGCDKDDDINVLIDDRDSQRYAIVTIGTQTWMAENLNYVSPVGQSWCYDDNANNCNTYGRLYDWTAATASAPAGWRLPSDADWATLINFLGGDAVAGGHLKEAGLTHWEAPNTGADNSSGFTALPAGGKLGTGGMFLTLNTVTYFWSSTEESGDATRARARYLYRTGAEVASAAATKIQGYSVRCIMN